MNILSPVQTDPTLLDVTCCVRLHIVTCCCVLLEVVAPSLKPVKRLATCKRMKGRATGKVQWKVEVKDNSLIVDPKEKITVNSSHDHQPSQEFPIGKTSVRVIATDDPNIANCYF